MGEWKREIELVKKQCARDPGARANWIAILIGLGVCVVPGVLMLPLILM